MSIPLKGNTVVQEICNTKFSHEIVGIKRRKSYAIKNNLLDAKVIQMVYN